MNTTNGNILVLWDNTEETLNSFKHAYQLAKYSNFGILLLRILKKRKLFESKETFNKEVSEEEALLKESAQNLTNSYSVNLQTIIKIGDLKSAVKETLEEHKCLLIVTPESISQNKGVKVNVLQEFSSYGEVDIPIIVANKPPREDFTSLEVIVPMEHEPEFKDTIDWIIQFSRIFRCNFDFLKPVLTEAQPQRELISNIYFTKQMLEDNNIVYGIKTANKQNSFVDDIYEFANSIQANYIMSTTTNYAVYKRNEHFMHYPFICINPRKRMYRNFN